MDINGAEIEFASPLLHSYTIEGTNSPAGRFSIDDRLGLCKPAPRILKYVYVGVPRYVAHMSVEAIYRG